MCNQKNMQYYTALRADSQSASADHHPPGGESLGFDPAVLSVLGNGDHADFVRCFERINDKTLIKPVSAGFLFYIFF